MEKMVLLPVMLLAIVILEPGSCFLFKKRSQDQDSGNSIAHLTPRYWNDDIQPCIERHCLPYQGKNLYIRCLQHFCPGGLLAVPRDLDTTTPFPVAMILGETEFCSTDYLDNSPIFLTDYDTDMLPGSVDGEFAFVYGVYKLCRASFCKDVHGSAHNDCIRERCCGQTEDSTHERHMRKRTAMNKLISPDEKMVRRRRINDEVAQCIMSYCNKRAGNDRVTCIVNKCHRA